MVIRTHFHGHDDLCRSVKHLLYSAVVASSKFLVELELGHVDGEGGSAGEVDARGMDNSLAAKPQCTGRIAAEASGLTIWKHGGLRTGSFQN